MSKPPRKGRPNGRYRTPQDLPGTEEPWLDPEWQAYVTRTQTELVPMIEGSSIGLSIVPRNPEDVDIKFAVELGLMIMFDKPIIMVVAPNQLIPEHLRRVADEIVVHDPEHPDHESMVKAMDRVAKKYGGSNGDG
jgi:hypothetical protein